MFKFWKYAKHIESSEVNKRLYCFANISATKALIFMKFDIYINKELPEKIHKRSALKSAHMRLKRVPAWQNMHKFFIYFLMNSNLKFHKDQSFHCEDICKAILKFVYSWTFYVFCIFSKFEHQSSPKFWKIHKIPRNI